MEPLRKDELNGFFLVDKPVGPSSAAVTNRLKWLINQHLNAQNVSLSDHFCTVDTPSGTSNLTASNPKRRIKVKIGHGGTLDPLACGLLPVGVGKATKQLQALLDGPKTYRFTLQFGSATTTDDAEGSVIATSSHRPTTAEILAILPTFLGTQQQVPPAFSALKINGMRAYDLARAGQNVVLQPRTITIHSLVLENENNAEITLQASVSKGTYIRVLARNLAESLGTVGHVTFLQRTQHGPFQLSQAIPFQTLDESIKSGHISHHLLALAAE